MAEYEFELAYEGGDADRGLVDLYDASNSFYGFARTLAILGHYYITGDIIAKAPNSQLDLYLSATTEGSLKQQIVAGAVGAIIAAPFTTFVSITMGRWIPQPNPQLETVVEELREANRLKRLELGLDEKKSERELEEAATVNDHLDKNDEKIQVIRSITSSSFKTAFRPVGRSVEKIAITEGPARAPIGIVNPWVLARIEADHLDDEIVIITGVVNSFSRSSKSGVIFSKDISRGFRFEYVAAESLPRQDDFSWSQFYGRPVRVSGQFVRFFDNKIKKFRVIHVERCSEPEIESYFEDD